VKRQVSAGLCAALALIGCVGILVSSGCKKDDAVDAPLTKATGPIPARPDKPTITPGGAGGGSGVGQ